jgi:ABC-2 type transport system permease protein
MAAEASRRSPAAPPWHIGPLSRVYGFGSIYAKTIRDSRLAFIIVAGLMAGLMLAAGAAIGKAYPTVESRQDLVRLATDLPPILQGLAGKPVNVGTLGGYMQWKYGPFFTFIAGMWSILALSGTLAGESRRGSLDFVATAPFGRRRIALEKVAAHLTMVGLAMAILAFASWLVGAVFGTVPGDEIAPAAAIGFALWVGLIALASGGLAFALAPFLGRGASAGIAGFVFYAGYLLSGYQTVVPAFALPANLSWFSWTADFLPLAGTANWLLLLPVALVAMVFLAVGVVAFTRRDLGAGAGLRTPSLPAGLLGLRGPTGRAFGERLPVSLAWGLGLAVFGLVIAASSRALADEFETLGPDTLKLFRTILPNIDITTAGGFLQFVFGQIGYIVIGFAAVTLVAGWASDETSGRLEMLLATPLSRRSWAVRSGLGVFLAIGLMTLVFALGVGLGAVLAGSDALTPMTGSIALGLYAAALTGVGLAIGGIVRTTIAAELVAAVVVMTFLIDLLAPALKLPDWFHQLALTAHMGLPLVGTWDPAGIVACLVLAGGGLLLAGWGIDRRDVRH